MTPIDLIAFDACQTRACVPATPRCADALDFDHDSDVDMDDFGALQRKARNRVELLYVIRVESYEPLLNLKPMEVLKSLATQPAER